MRKWVIDALDDFEDRIFQTGKYAPTDEQILSLTAPEYSVGDCKQIEAEFKQFVADNEVTVDELQKFSESGAGEVLYMICSGGF